MTVARRDGRDANPYYQWLREEPSLDSRGPQLSVTDNDHWVHQYSTRKERPGKRPYLYDSVMLIEVKAFNKSVPDAQRDTLDVVGALLRTNFRNGRRRMVKIKDTRPGRAGCKRNVLCFGEHVLRMSGDRPDTSKNLFWDDKPITYEELAGVYRYERDPDNPSKMLDLRRHHELPFRERHPSLFAWALLLMPCLSRLIN